MVSNMVTIRKNFGVFVHPHPLVEAMVCLESITARTSLSNWLVIDGSIPPDTLNTAQFKYTQIHKYKIHKYTNTITCLSQIVLSLMAPYHPIQSTLRHTHTFTLRVALILIHTLCIVLHSTLHTAKYKCTYFTCFMSTVQASRVAVRTVHVLQKKEWNHYLTLQTAFDHCTLHNASALCSLY